MVGRITPVRAAAATPTVEVSVYRSDRIPESQTGGIAVRAVSTDLLSTLQGRVRSGTFVNEATSPYPTVVFGSVAAERLGIGRGDGSVQVWLGGRWFSVVGILKPLPLAPEVDRSALIGLPIAASAFYHNGSFQLYVRTRPDQVDPRPRRPRTYGQSPESRGGAGEPALGRLGRPGPRPTTPSRPFLWASVPWPS